MTDEFANEYQVIAVDDGTSNERAGEVFKPRPEWDQETRIRWDALMQRMERLGWLDRV